MVCHPQADKDAIAMSYDGRLGNAQFRSDPTGGQAGLDPRRHRAGMTG